MLGRNTVVLIQVTVTLIMITIF